MEDNEKKLKKVIDKYMESLPEPNIRLLDGAKNQMRVMAEKKVKMRKWKRLSLSFACAIFLLFMGVTVYQTFFYSAVPIVKTSTVYYASEIGRVTIEEGVKESYGVVEVDFEIIESSCYGYYLKSDGELTDSLVMIEYLFSYYSNNSLKEVTVIYDYATGVYSELEAKVASLGLNLSGDKVESSTVYKNGEYITDSYLEDNKTQIFINVKSPDRNAIDEILKYFI